MNTIKKAGHGPETTTRNGNTSETSILPRSEIKRHPGYSELEVQRAKMRPPLPAQIRVTDDGLDARYDQIRRHADGLAVYVPVEELMRHLPTLIITPEQLACAD